MPDLTLFCSLFRKNSLFTFHLHEHLRKENISKQRVRRIIQTLLSIGRHGCCIGLLVVLSLPMVMAQSNKAGRLSIVVQDQNTRQPTAVRVKLTQNGYAVKQLPAKAVAIMYGLWDHADGYGFQPDSSFYVEGSFQLELPAGNYQLQLAKGNEYLSQTHSIRIEAGKTFKQTYSLSRWIDTPKMGWYSADGHIHIRRSPREDSLLATWIKAEDIHVGVMLRMGDFWEIYYPQYAYGEKGIYQQKDYMFVPGQEDPRTPELGHVLSLGASDRVRMKEDYYYYDKVFDSLGILGGLNGYAHGGDSFHGYRGLILDGLRKKLDYLEILQYCASSQPLMQENYYHLLNMGIPITAIAGSDFPWCGQDHSGGKPENSAQIGNVRFYTYTGAEFSYSRWKEGLRKGHTFVSNGPILDFKVNNHLPGDKIEAEKGQMLTITAQAFGHSSQQPLEALEIVRHGKVLARVTAKDLKQTSGHLTLELKLPAEQGIWLAARCFAENNGVAHTTPVYVSVDGRGFHDPATIAHYIGLSEQYLKELENEIQHKSDSVEYQAWRYRSGLMLRIAEVRQILQTMRDRKEKSE
ncbi:CehA/McbA family metallohydrolase [Rhodocytophaga aerolata]